MAVRLWKRVSGRTQSIGATSAGRNVETLERLAILCCGENAPAQGGAGMAGQGFVSFSGDHSLISKDQAFEQQAFHRESKFIKPSLHFVHGRQSAPSGSSLGFIEKGRGTGTETTVDRWGFTGSLVSWICPKPYCRGFHSTGGMLTTEVVGMDEDVGGVHGSTGDETRLTPSETGARFSLDLPKLENLTSNLIVQSCRIIESREWSSEIERELEELDAVFTPFLIQQIVAKLSEKPENADKAWVFFQWARMKAGKQLSLRAHISILDALGRIKKIELMKEAFELTVEDGHQKTAWAYNAALKWCSAARDADAARYFRNKMKENDCVPSVVTYTRLIDALAKRGHHEEVLETFSQMLQANCPPNITTYNALIRASGVAGQPEVASSLFDKLSELGCRPNHTTYATIISLHVEAGKPEKALEYFKMMKATGMVIGDEVSKLLQKNLPSATNTEVVASEGVTSTSTTVDAGDEQQAYVSHPDVDVSVGEVRGRIIPPNGLVQLLQFAAPKSVKAQLDKAKPIVYPRYVMTVLQRLHNPEIAMIFFDWAKTQPFFKHNDHTYSMMITVLGRSRNADSMSSLGRVIAEMQDMGILMNTPIFTALITSYGRAKSIEGALKIFEQMKEWGCRPDVVTYTSLIHLLTKHGNYEQAMRMYEEMLKEKVEPNVKTYSVIIYNLMKAGKVAEAIALLKDMPELGCQPNAITFASIIDHCAKEGNVGVAMDLYTYMEASGVKPLRGTIIKLHTACKKAGRVDEADKLTERFRKSRVWDETYKSTTQKVAQEVLFKDVIKYE